MIRLMRQNLAAMPTPPVPRGFAAVQTLPEGLLAAMLGASCEARRPHTAGSTTPRLPRRRPNSSRWPNRCVPMRGSGRRTRSLPPPPLRCIALLAWLHAQATVASGRVLCETSFCGGRARRRKRDEPVVRESAPAGCPGQGRRGESGRSARPDAYPRRHRARPAALRAVAARRWRRAGTIARCTLARTERAAGLTSSGLRRPRSEDWPRRTAGRGRSSRQERVPGPAWMRAAIPDSSSGSNSSRYCQPGNVSQASVTAGSSSPMACKMASTAALPAGAGNPGAGGGREPRRDLRRARLRDRRAARPEPVPDAPAGDSQPKAAAAATGHRACGSATAVPFPRRERRAPSAAARRAIPGVPCIQACAAAATTSPASTPARAGPAAGNGR